MTLGFVPANRGFFSTELAAKMRTQTLEAMRKQGIEVIVPGEDQTKAGCVETLAEAELCADLFRAADVQGIVIGAMNFGDEQAAAWVVRQARLDVPILIFGCQEEEVLTPQTARRDSFCGLLSIGDALRQIGATYTVAHRPICYPTDASFARDVDMFVRTCRVVQGVKNARYGQVGVRPEPFWTCRFDEQKLQRLGPTTVVFDTTELIAGAKAIADDEPELQSIVKDIGAYADTSAVTETAVRKSAKLELLLKRWRQEHAIDAFAIQCWTAVQEQFGVCTCAAMSRLAEQGIPCACEADVLGTLSMHAAMLASGTPAMLADWNNLHNEDDELVNLWHCGAFPKCFAKERPRIATHGVLVSCGATKAEDSEGVVEFEIAESPVTLTRVTQDPDGQWKALVAQGRFEDNPAATFGTYGWCRIRHLDRLYRNVLARHFPHHVAAVQGHVGSALWEALGNYLGLEVYHAAQATPGLYAPDVFSEREE